MSVTLREAFCVTAGKGTRTPKTVVVPGPVVRRSEAEMIADAFAGRFDDCLLDVFDHFGNPCASRGRIVTDATGTTWFCAADPWMDDEQLKTGFDEEPHGQAVQTQEADRAST